MTIERFFLSYTGIQLPLRLTGELDAASLRHRNTYLRAQYDDAGRLLRCEKLVYGEVEMRHEYRYADDGRLVAATITQGDEPPRELRLAAG